MIAVLIALRAKAEARAYNVPIQSTAQVGDIVVVGIYGVDAVSATPPGWSLLASIGVIAALYGHTVTADELGSFIGFPLGSNNKVAAFVLNVTGASGVSARMVPSAGAVSSLNFTVSNSAAPLIVAGCFSTLSQTFMSPFAVAVPNAANPQGFGPVNASGLGTHAPSVVLGPTTASANLTFGTGLASAVVGFELDISGTAPSVTLYAATTESDVPAHSPSLSQQTTGHGTATPVSWPALTVNQNDAMVLTAVFYNSTAGITQTVTDNAGGNWAEVSGEPNHEVTSTFFIHNDLWYAVGHPVGAATVTSTLSATPTNIYVNLSVYSGVATINPVDGQTNNISGVAGTTAQTGTINTSYPVDLLVGSVSGDADNGTAPTITNYGTSGGAPTGLNRTGVSFLFPAYQVVSALGNYGFQFVVATSMDWSGSMVALQGAQPTATASAINAWPIVQSVTPLPNSMVERPYLGIGP